MAGGLDEQPTIHEGVAARARENMIVFRYQLRHIAYGKGRLSRRLGAVRPVLERYSGLVRQIKEKGKERKTLLAEKKATPKLRNTRHRELSARITGLTEELRSQKAMLLRELACRDDSEIGTVKKDIAGMEADLDRLGQQEKKCAADLKDALKQYADLKEQAKDLDPDELLAARLALRPEKERESVRRIQAIYGDNYSSVIMFKSRQGIDKICREQTPCPSSIRSSQHKRRLHDHER